MRSIEKILVHFGDFVRKPIDPAEVYFLEAVGDQTLIHTRSARAFRDVRSLGELLPRFTPYGFVRFNKTDRTVTFECWPRYADPVPRRSRKDQDAGIQGDEPGLQARLVCP